MEPILVTPNLSNVLVTQWKHWGTDKLSPMEHVAEVAFDLGYPFVEWNGMVYGVIAGPGDLEFVSKIDIDSNLVEETYYRKRVHITLKETGNTYFDLMRNA